MAKTHWGLALVAGGFWLGSALSPAAAQTGDKFNPNFKSDPARVARVLEYAPRFKGADYGIEYSKVSAQEQPACTLKLFEVSNSPTQGYVLLDPQNRPMRRVQFTDGSKMDTVSFYKDGVEVYREIDSNGNNQPEQYRWFNAGGGKWGVDLNEDGRIDQWKMISAEEAAREAYHAVVTRDLGRLQCLMVTDQELRGLKLSDAHAARIRDNLSKAKLKFAELCAKATSLNAQAQFVRVESAVPQCVPAHAVLGPAQELLRFPSRDILYQAANKNHEWLHTGEMILVGPTWKLTDVPSLSDIIEGATTLPSGSLTAANPDVDPLLKELPELDKSPPPWPGTPGKYPDTVEYIRKRVALLEKIHAKTSDAKDKEIWLRQILDNLATGHQANKGDNSFLVALGTYKNKLAQSAPGSNIAGYAHYREMWARYAFDLFGESKDPAKTQREWTAELEGFVKLYSKADDAPDALYHLAMNSEFSGPDKQLDAKKYYGQIAANFADHPLAPKAAGAVKRLDLTGKPMQLAANTLQNVPFDVAKLKGKVVVVYYWASSCNACVGDFARMKLLQTANAGKVEIVTVNLDETPAAASTYLAAHPLPGTHLFQATEQARGLESPLAIQYGIVSVPTIILVGKDGLVIDRSIQINELEDAVKKAL